MISFIVYDQWLPEPQREMVAALVEAHFESAYGAGAGEGPEFSWYSPKQGCHISRLSGSYLEVAQAYIEGLTSRLQPLLGCTAEGYEWWSNHGNTLDWHVDRDETLFRKTGRIRHPLWSTVLYTNVSIRGHGGELILLSDETQSLPYGDDLSSAEIAQKYHSISPRTNRLMVFRRGIYHRINPFDGVRASLAMNLWDVTPAEFDAYRESRFCHRIS